jgi:succinoglycan biosynthesis transport protein ExoP
VELKDYLRPLVSKWWLILASVLIATASSYVATRQQLPIYRASVTLMVGHVNENPNPTGNDLSLTAQLAATYADIAKRDPVRSGVMQALGISKLPDYTVAAVPNTQLIELSVNDTNPERARAVADALVNQLIGLSPSGSNQSDQSRQSFVNQQLDELEAGIKDTKDQITQKQAELTTIFSARQIADTQAQIAGLQNKLATLQNNYGLLLQNTQRGATNALDIVEPAVLPTVPIGPNKAVTILLAAAIAFILAAAAAYLLDYLDDSLKNPEDVQRSLDLPTLGAVPALKGGGVVGEVLMQVSPQAVEAYNVLCTNLQFAAVGGAINSLLVTSAEPGEGKSLTAANLASAYAQAGQRVILVDGDVRRPSLHRLFGLPNNVGVTGALLQNHLDPTGVLQKTHIAGLRVLTAGQVPPNAAALLGSARMRALLATLKADADLLILDSPPATAVADAAILSSEVDGVLLVLDAGRTRREMARRALAALSRVNARVVGVAFNRMPARGNEFYYYYHYSSEYSAEAGANGTSASGNKGRRVSSLKLPERTTPSE